jgi:REP element-mobilizing transposase RayT
MSQDQHHIAFGQIRRNLGTVFHELARRKECEIEEGHLMPDHVHMLIRFRGNIRARR